MLITQTVDHIKRSRNNRQDNVFARVTFRFLGIPFFRRTTFLYFTRKQDNNGNRI